MSIRTEQYLRWLAIIFFVLASGLRISPAAAVTLTPNQDAGSIYQLVTLADDTILAIYQAGEQLEVRHRQSNGQPVWSDAEIIFGSPAEENYTYTIFAIETLGEVTAVILSNGGDDFRLVSYSSSSGLNVTDMPVGDIQLIASSDDTLVLANTSVFITWTQADGFSNSIALPSHNNEEDAPEILITDSGTIGYIVLDPTLGEEDNNGNLHVQLWDSIQNFFTSGPVQLEKGEFFYSLNGATTTARNAIVFAASTGYTDDESGFKHGGSSYLFGWSNEIGWYDSVAVFDQHLNGVLDKENKRIKFIFDTALSYDTIDAASSDYRDKTVYRWVHDKGWKEDLYIDTDSVTTFVTVDNQREEAYYLATWTEEISDLNIYKWNALDGWKIYTTLTLSCEQSCTEHHLTVSNQGHIAATWLDGNNYAGQVYHAKKKKWQQLQQFNYMDLDITYAYPSIVITSPGDMITLWKENDGNIYWKRWKQWEGWQTRGKIETSTTAIYAASDLILNNGTLIPDMQDGTLTLYRIKADDSLKRKIIADDVDSFMYKMIDKTVYFMFRTEDNELVVERVPY